ncbi:MAG: hypothetical protein KG003_09815 [Bacteroidetes bacterium]|nr:hypothetical protein [Bacteroidota bacterium]
MISPIFWTAYSHLERHVLINEIEETILKYGSILEFKTFSDLAISITLELEEQRLQPLYEALCRIMKLDAFEALAEIKMQDRIVYLNISFSTGSGDLKNIVPNVPG